MPSRIIQRLAGAGRRISPGRLSSKAVTGLPLATSPVNGTLAMGVVGVVGSMILGNMATRSLNNMTTFGDPTRASMLGSIGQLAEASALSLSGGAMFTAQGFEDNAGLVAGIGVAGAGLGLALGARSVRGVPAVAKQAYFSEALHSRTVAGHLGRAARGLGNRLLNFAGSSKALAGLAPLAGAVAGLHVTSRMVDRLAQRMLQEGGAGFRPSSRSTAPTARRFRSAPSGSRVARRSGVTNGWSGDTVLQLHRSGGRGAVLT